MSADQDPVLLIVPGVPVPQGSVRAFLAGGRAVVAQGGSQWNRARLAEFRADLAEQFTRKQGKRINGAVTLTVHALFARPKSHYGTGRNAHRLKPSAPRAHTKKPDLDKLIRAVGDALTNAGVIEDDARINKFGESCKMWAPHGVAAKIIIWVEPSETPR